MKKSALILALPLLTSVAVVGLPSVAQADTPGCVTRAEYRHVHKGMTKHRVAHIFDTAGKREAYATSGGYTAEIRSYKTCRRYSAVAISYGNGRLDAKSAVWVG
jgi:hypothetical protein